MVQITVFCQPAAFDKVLAKMEARAQSDGFSKNHLLYGLSKEQLKPVLWGIIEANLVEYCKEPKPDYAVLDHGFIVGTPLDDTIFMLTGAVLPRHVPQHTFDVAHSPNGNTGATEFVADFYTHVN